MHEVIEHEKLLAIKEHRQVDIVSMVITNDVHERQKEYNAPLSHDITFIFKNINGQPPVNRDIALWPRKRYELLVPSTTESTTIRINTQQDICDPMTYALLFPHGDRGWHDNIASIDSEHRVTQLQYYSYRLMVRDEFNPLLHAGKLTQQFVTDSYIKIEGNRIKYINEHQDDLLRINTKQGKIMIITILRNIRI